MLQSKQREPAALVKAFAVVAEEVRTWLRDRLRPLKKQLT
jgi:hypothetical protein